MSYLTDDSLAYHVCMCFVAVINIHYMKILNTWHCELGSRQTTYCLNVYVMFRNGSKSMEDAAYQS